MAVWRLCLTAAAALGAMRVHEIKQVHAALTWPSGVSVPPTSWRFCCSLTFGLRTCL